MSGARWCAGMAALADRYDLFLVDPFGVLHDGAAAYPGALDCLERLRRNGRRVVVLSNSGRRAGQNARRLEAIGVPASAYDALVTSGEAVRAHLAARDDPWYAALGTRCLPIGSGGDVSTALGLGLDLVGDVAAADFVLLYGCDAPERDAADYDPLLRAAAGRRLPMVCANPDVSVVTAAGLIYGPGRLAWRYEQAFGGEVRYVGKPHAGIYRHCLALAGGSVPPGRVLAIGDSLEHDVAGGRGVGAATALVAGGVHRDVPDAELPALFRRVGVTPDYVLPRFIW